MIPAIKIGKYKLIEISTPEIRGAKAIPKEVIDWFIPKISPCEDSSANPEIMACEFGDKIPFEIATNGRIK